MVLVCRAIIAAILLLPFLYGESFSQKREPLSLVEIETLLKNFVSPKRVMTLMEEVGVDSEITDEAREKLIKAGADEEFISDLNRIALEWKRKRLEEEQRRAEEEIRTAPMAVVPAGAFWMGSADGRENEMPRRRVYLDTFNIDRYEVTNSEYEKFMKATGHGTPEFWSDLSLNELQQPVVGVTWHDAEAYCKWAKKRLPTEAEWEKAARGTDGRKYPWGNDEPDSSKANYYFWWLFFTRTAHVGSYPNGASPYGVHDMAGNVWEWVADWYDESYYQRAPERNPKGPNSGQYRVFRGGAWLIYPWDLRSSYRYAENPMYRHHYLGFRCAG